MGGASGPPYGFRGEALSSIASLALVDVTSRVHGRESYAKIIKNSHTLYLGPAPARGELGRAHGTTVAVRELYNAVPVRRAAMAAASASGVGSGGSVAACRRAVEALALVHPHVRWVLWEERSVGGPRRVLWLQGVSAVYGREGCVGLTVWNRARRAWTCSARCTARRAWIGCRACACRVPRGGWMGLSAWKAL